MGAGGGQRGQLRRRMYVCTYRGIVDRGAGKPAGGSRGGVACWPLGWTVGDAVRARARGRAARRRRDGLRRVWPALP